MIPGLISAGVQALPALGGLLIGENSIFSGKGRQASREAGKAFDASQSMGIGQRYYDYLGSKQSQANRGLGASTLGLMQRAAGRSTAAGLGALRGKRSLLGGIGSIAQAGQESAMDIGAANEQALSRNREGLDQAQLQVAGLEQQNALRKSEEAQSYWANRKQESNQAISSNLASLGSAIGSGIAAGAAPGLGKMASGPAATSRAGFDSFIKSKGSFGDTLAKIKASGVMPKMTLKGKN